MNKNRITQSVVLSLTSLVAAIAWYCLRQTLYHQTGWLWPLGGFFILLIFLSLGWMLVKSRAILLTTLAIILVCFFFSFGFRLEYLIVLFLALLFFLFGSERVLNEKEARIKIQLPKILSRGLPPILTGLALITATVYYFSPLAMTTKTEIKIPRPWFNIIIQPMMTTIEKQLQENLEKQLGEKLPTNLQTAVPQLAQQFDLQLAGHEDLEDILYQITNQQLNQYSQPYKEYFPLGLAIGFFFLLKALSIPLVWLVILLTWLFFRILTNLGAIKIEQKAVLQEVIEL